MMFRLSEDGKTQVNLALVRSVQVAPAHNGVGAIAAFQIRAELQGAAGVPVVLKTYPVDVPKEGQDAAELEKSAAQKAMDYLARLPLSIALEGVSELVKIIAPYVAIFDTAPKRGKATKKKAKPSKK